jgi:alpha-1,6-mannosyltransferase
VVTAPVWVQARLGLIGTSRRHHPGLIAGVGFLATAAVVLAGGRSPVPIGMALPRSFAGVLSPQSSGGGVTAAVVIVAVAVLLSCWWWLLAEASAGRATMRGTAWIVAAWAVPLLVGPPVLSFDAYAYLAQGEMVVAGLDPYATGPLALGADPSVDRVDPFWRSSPSPYGPIALVTLRAVATLDRGLVGSVLALRLLALVGVAVAVAGALLLSPPRRQPVVLALTLANPVTLLHLVGGAHVDALLAGVVVLILLALSSGRDVSALLLAAVAVATKVTVLPVFLLVVVLVVRHRGIRMLWFSLPALLLPFVLSGFVLARPWGFIQALLVPGAGAAWYAPASLVGLVLRMAAGPAGLPDEDRYADIAGQVLVLLAGAAVVGRVLIAAWRDRQPEATERTIVRAGTILLVAAIALPSLYSWYLGPAIVVVASASNSCLRRVLVLLCSALTFSSLPSLYDASPWLVAAAWTVALGVLAVRAVRQVSLPASGTNSPDSGPRAADIPAPTGPQGVPAGEARPLTARPGPHAVGNGVAADRPPRSRRLHRRLVTGTRAAELLVLPALILALTAPWARADVEADAHADLDPDTAGSASLDEHVAAVARVSGRVEEAYPGSQVAQVLPRPAPLGAQQFAVELVLPGRGTCWLHVAVPRPGGPARLHDLPRAAHGCPSVTRRPTPPVVRPLEREAPSGGSHPGEG